MAVKDLPALGKFLLGEGAEDTPGWLQAVHSSTSPLGDFLALGFEQRLVLLAARYSSGRRQLVPVFQGCLPLPKAEERLTSLLVLPVLSSRTTQSSWHATIAGFTSGAVRVYTESGQLLLEKAFHDSPVKRINVQAMPEGKHFTQVLHSQAVQELVVVHPSVVVTISAGDLFSTLAAALSSLAKARAGHTEEEEMVAPLPGTLLMVTEQKIEDCASLVSQQTAYCQYLGLTMQGGYVDSRHKPLHTAPSFLTTGLDPFLHRLERPNGSGPGLSSVVSSVKSGLWSAVGGLWGGSGVEKGPKPDPSVTLAVSHSIKDEGRHGLEMLLSPDKVYTAVRDAQNRVMLVETSTGTVVQAWRGYHRVMMAWTITSLPKEEEVTTDLQLAVLLLLYLPRRGLIEVWSPEQKAKVTEFHVSQHGLLLRSCLATLDDGIPRRREAVNMFASFLPPSGVLQHFHIPFHALSTSNTEERDLQLQEEVVQELGSGKDIEKMAGLIVEVRNARLRSHLLTKLVGEETIEAELPQLLAALSKNVADAAEDNVSIENKLWRSKVKKLNNLALFYQGLSNSSEKASDQMDNVQSMEEVLCHLLATDLDEVEALLKVAPMSTCPPENPPLTMQDFLSCFETEGEVGNWRGKDQPRVKLRRHLAPLLAIALYRATSRLCTERGEEANDHFSTCGLLPQEFLHLALSASLNSLDCSIKGFSRLHATLSFLLNLNANVDDRHRASCQEVVRAALTKAPISPSVCVLATIWRAVLASQGSLSLSVWAEEWGRRATQAAAWCNIQDSLAKLLPDSSAGSAPHTIASVFECGNGRIAEILARAMLALGCSSTDLASKLMGDHLEEESAGKALLSTASAHFPLSSNPTTVLVHLLWEEMQAWSRDREAVMPMIIQALWSLSSPSLRARLASLIFRTFLEKPVQEVARLTEKCGKSGANRGARCKELLQQQPHLVTGMLETAEQLLDCQLQSLALSQGEGTGDEGDRVGYDDLGSGATRAHLLDHLLAGPPPFVEAASLQHQLTQVLHLSWSLEVAVRPLQVFTTSETSQLLQTQPGVFSSLFADHNVGVGKARAAWVADLVEAAVGRIHELPGEGRQHDTAFYQEVSTKLIHLARLWFLSDLVKMCQVESLFRAGLDYLALELRPGVTDVQGLASRLLEVALLRVAKFVWAGESQGRVASLPSALVPHLAERREKAAMVVEAGLVDTVALLAWTAASLEDGDKHSLATSALAAAQVLTVRNNRGTT